MSTGCRTLAAVPTACPACGYERICLRAICWVAYEAGEAVEIEAADLEYAEPLEDDALCCRCGHVWQPA